MAQTGDFEVNGGAGGMSIYLLCHQPQLAGGLAGFSLCCDSFGGFANLSASYFFGFAYFFILNTSGVEILYENFVYNNQLEVTVPS